MKPKKPKFDLWEVIVIALISALIMSGSTGYMVYRNNNGGNCTSLSKNPHLNEFIDSYNHLLNNFYGELDEPKIIQAAISGMMSFLDDPYTTYLDEQNSEFLFDSLRSTYEGIGVRLSNDEPALIDEVFPDSPAAKAGIKKGDIIKSVNGVEVKDKSANDIATLIRGSEEVNINLIIDREGEELTFRLKKATLLIPLNEQLFKRNDKRVGYIQFSRFSDEIGIQFKNSLENLEKQGIDSLIIDLRNNTGGYLRGTTDVASLFLRQGAVIFQLKSKLQTTKERVTDSGNRKYPVIVLINGGTASAGEVLAAALRDSYNARLVGTNSFGKGLVQQTSQIGSGSMLKYTSAEWLTPKGRMIEGVGLKPDIVVEEDGTFLEPEKDRQLQRAIGAASR